MSLAKSRPRSRVPLPTPWDRPQSDVAIQGSLPIVPGTTSRQDVRAFLHSGLRFLKRALAGRGYTEKDIQAVVLDAFDDFYDAEEELWHAIQEAYSARPAILPNVDYPLSLGGPPREVVPVLAEVQSIRQGRRDLPLSDCDWSALMLEEDDD